jgi:hypothetical protein
VSLPVNLVLASFVMWKPLIRQRVTGAIANFPGTCSMHSIDIIDKCHRVIVC